MWEMCFVNSNHKIWDGKKGQAIHTIAYGLAAVFIAIAFLFLAYFISQVNTVVQSSDQFSSEIKTSLSNTNTRMPKVMDASFTVMVVLSSLALVASAFLIDTALIFFVISLPVFLISILANAIFANLIDEFGNTSAMSATYANFPMMSFLASHWVTIIVVVGFLSMVAFFGGKSVR